MYSIICLFQWLPDHYNFRAAIMRVFNITADQLVSLRKKRQHNIVIFTVASQEIFDSLSEFYCRILFFPIMGRNILECFAYPKSPKYQFLTLSADLDYDMADTQIGNLSELGTVLYRQHVCYMVPFTSSFQTDSIGVVLLRKNETNDSAEPAAAQSSSQRRPGNGQEDQAAAGAMPNVPVAGHSSGGTTYFIQIGSSAEGLQQPFCMLGCLHHLETDPLQSVFPYQHQGSQISTFHANEARMYNRNFRRQRGGSGHGTHSSSMGLSSPAKAPKKGKRASKEPSPKVEHPSDTPKAEDENPKSLSDKQE